MNLKQVPFTKYYRSQFNKKQIYLHHTAGAVDGELTFQFWENDPIRIATCVAISRDGTIVQGFSSKYWAYHLGLKTKHFEAYNLPYKDLNKISIGIEVCNWGWLTEKEGKFYTYTNRELPAERVIKLDKPYRGHLYWENYTDQQIEAVRDLLKLWELRYNINISYCEDIWNVTKRALSGSEGVYTHNSVRPDKADVYPHPKLIAMLKKL